MGYLSLILLILLGIVLMILDFLVIPGPDRESKESINFIFSMNRGAP